MDNVIVSDSHIVKYRNIWIPVSSHPDAIKYESYNEPFLYCLNTTHKIIKINNQIFTDWDEIYDETLNRVLNNKIIPIKSIKDIHKYLDWGFAESTKIKLFNGNYKEINKISIFLESGEIVYGVVEIDGIDIAENVLYNLGENNVIEGYVPDLNILRQQIPATNQKLYHLLTNTKTFKLGNTIIPDYNAAIDRFLEIPM